LITRLTRLELAEVPEQVAAARDSTKPAPSVTTFATVRLKSATDASEWLYPPCATVAACSTLAWTSPATFALRSDASAAPPCDASGPASDRTVRIPRMLASRTTACPL